MLHPNAKVLIFWRRHFEASHCERASSIQKRLSIWCTPLENVLLSDENVNNSGAIQTAVVVLLPYLQALWWRVCYIQILTVLIFWRWHIEGIAFWRHFSYPKETQHLMHSTTGCDNSRRVSIIQVRAFSAVRGSDALFPNDFGEDLFENVTGVRFFEPQCRCQHKIRQPNWMHT